MLARTVSLLAVLALALPGAALAEDPPFTGWSNLLPGSPGLAYDPGSADECVSGKLNCVDKVIREMTRRFAPLASSCQHNAIFALTYLRTTEEYRGATTTPGFFEDPGFVNHEDAVFAAYYFRAYDDYASGRRAAVPAAWRVAFDAARDRTVSAQGNVFLGMNAHINRDLPYVLEGIGLVKPDGSSRKPDHDKVNEFLNRIGDEVFREIARRFDPTAVSADNGTLLDDWASFQIVPAWREQAWRYAEMLAATKGNPVARASVEA
ncbi:MAG TPA: DUF5995 family protein, partial [Solirubrobacteraceae bacterium]|nr:DUF5995 family protein [Solirubrobacteraceae bacterium]